MRNLHKSMYALFLASNITLLSTNAYAQALVTSPATKGTVAVKSWKALRDADVVKQDLDYSCGAASVATVLNGYYHQQVTEEDILKAMNKEDGMASFADMAKILPQYGFKGVGLALDFEQLRRLKVPAIVYLRYRDDDHFSVVRGISNDTVWLGDSSWGNRKFSIQQFLKMWQTREEEQHKGKVVIIVPAEHQHIASNDLFFTSPEKTDLPLELLTVRRF